MGRKIAVFRSNVWLLLIASGRCLFTGLYIIILFGFAISCSAPPPSPPDPDFSGMPFPTLSDYGLFTGKLSALQPAPTVLPYDLATPLFSDYAHKARFVWMPPGSKARTDEQGKLVFPENTILVKHFFYPADFRKPQSQRDLVETRLLVKRKEKWEAFTYQWDEKGREAILMQVGNVRPVQWTSESGIEHRLDYIIPNKNQCKSCHNASDQIQPIGPKVPNLNFSMHYPDGTFKNQLMKWKESGFLDTIPAIAMQTTYPHWDKADHGTLAERAAAYLDVNCGHCHRPGGPAQTTGTYLHWEEASMARKGVFKNPVAAGKGSGGRHFGIVPGQPDSSILLYRMEATDPGIMMPEIGRITPHTEGIALIRDWIASLEDNE